MAQNDISAKLEEIRALLHDLEETMSASDEIRRKLDALSARLKADFEQIPHKTEQPSGQ